MVGTVRADMSWVCGSDVAINCRKNSLSLFAVQFNSIESSNVMCYVLQLD